MQEILFACIVQTVGSMLKAFKTEFWYEAFFNVRLELFGKKQ